MKVSEQFLKARNHKHLSYFVVRNESNYGVKRTYMRLVINQPNDLNDQYNPIFIETDTEVKLECFKHQEIPLSNFGICFGESIWNGKSHLKTFLKAIKKDSEVSFKVVAYNGSQVYDEYGMVHHTLYGIIDGTMYMLSYYIGLDNSASPVKTYIDGK